MYVVKKNFVKNIGNLDSKMNCEETTIKDRFILKFNKKEIKMLIVTQKNGLHFLKNYIDFIKKNKFIILDIDDRYEYV